jgi:hypothetical protein
MQMKVLFQICLMCSLFGALGGAAEVRVWTDAQDRKVEAALIKADDANVVLKLKNGKELPYPLEKLSAADRKYVEDNKIFLTDDTKILEDEKPKKNSEPVETADALNFDAPWPERVTFTEDPEIKTVEEDAGKKRFVYESANYQYVCDVRLAQSVVKGFAVMFEATHLYCRTLPLALNGGKKNKEKNEILLFEHFDDYVKAGGPPSSAGVFMGGRGVVMVPLTSLGVRPVGSSYMLDRDKSNRTLPHELTHQLTPDEYDGKGIRGWFTEGLAEYVGVSPYRAGSYNVRGNQKDILDYATGSGSEGKGGRGLGEKITIPALKKFMLQDYADFAGEKANFNYGCGLLITNYFFHMDGASDAKRIKAYLKALQEDKDAEKSLDILLDGRTFEKLEEDIVKAWGRKGVDITFEKE